MRWTSACLALALACGGAPPAEPRRPTTSPVPWSIALPGGRALSMDPAGEITLAGAPFATLRDDGSLVAADGSVYRARGDGVVERDGRALRWRLEWSRASVEGATLLEIDPVDEVVVHAPAGVVLQRMPVTGLTADMRQTVLFVVVLFQEAEATRLARAPDFEPVSP